MSINVNANTNTEFITEPERKIPIIANADLCVVGGSCTGVFAAVRAARLGLKVILIEKDGLPGGTAVAGLVNIWHSLYDTDNKNQVIAGLTYEVIQRLESKDSVIFSDNPSIAYRFNPWELTIILDELIRENKITLMLHTAYSAVIKENRAVRGIIVENSDGRGAINASFFIDATGDGRIARDLEIPSYTHSSIQPSTSCFYMQGNIEQAELVRLAKEHGHEFGLSDDWGWSTIVPGLDGITMRADGRVHGLRCDRAKDLTEAETEGRRQASAMLSLLRKYGNPDEKFSIASMCSHIGVRETVHYKCRFKANCKELLTGTRYSAPVLNGTYRVDIHHNEDNGITFKYLDGSYEIIYGRSARCEKGNWREEENIPGEPAKFYQIPYDILVCEEYDNFIPVGRMLNADEGAFGALRVMVNLNQLGEAAGVAAYLSLDSKTSVTSIDGQNVTKLLVRGGSAL